MPSPTAVLHHLSICFVIDSLVKQSSTIVVDFTDPNVAPIIKMKQIINRMTVLSESINKLGRVPDDVAKRLEGLGKYNTLCQKSLPILNSGAIHRQLELVQQLQRNLLIIESLFPLPGKQFTIPTLKVKK